MWKDVIRLRVVKLCIRLHQFKSLRIIQQLPVALSTCLRWFRVFVVFVRGLVVFVLQICYTSWMFCALCGWISSRIIKNRKNTTNAVVITEIKLKQNKRKTMFCFSEIVLFQFCFSVFTCETKRWNKTQVDVAIAKPFSDAEQVQVL